MPFMGIMLRRYGITQASQAGETVRKSIRMPYGISFTMGIWNRYAVFSISELNYVTNPIPIVKWNFEVEVFADPAKSGIFVFLRGGFRKLSINARAAYLWVV